MALIGVVNAKGSPGASTLAMELVRRHPREVVGVELDPSGGSWALRHDLSWDPGLVSLAATPATMTVESALEHGQRVGRGGVAICASPFADQVRASLELVEQRLMSWSDSLDGVLDVGRFDPCVLGVLRRCMVTLVVTRTRVEDVGQLQRLADTLRLAGIDARMVAIGSEQYSPREIAREVHLPLVDVTIPFTARPKVWDRAYQTLSDTVAAFTAVSSVQLSTVTGFGRSLHRHSRHEPSRPEHDAYGPDEGQVDGSREARPATGDGPTNDPRPSEWP